MTLPIFRDSEETRIVVKERHLASKNAERRIINAETELERGDAALHQQVVDRDQHEHRATGADDYRGAVDWHKFSGDEVAHWHAAAERAVVDAHHAAAHFVGG